MFIFLVLLLSLKAQAVVIGADDRRPIDFRATPEFQASGTLRCQVRDQFEREGSAQITGLRHLLTTAGHMFFDPSGRPIRFDSCQFQLANQKGTYPIDLALNKIGAYRPNDSREDWAILRLTSNVPEDIKPLLIPATEFYLSPGTPILQLTGYAKDYVSAHDNTCTIQDVYRYPVYPIQTDCDSSPGTSGSAQLFKTKYGWMLVGIHVGDAKLQDGFPYDPSRNFNTSTPLAGRFLTELQKSIDQN